MAVARKNSIADCLRGKAGDLVFRRFNGKTVVSKAPEVSKGKRRSSALQKVTNDHFTEASAYAKRVTRDPVMRSYYMKKAKAMKVPNAYTAALTECMRRAEVAQVDMSKFRGKVGDRVRVVVRKKDFSIREVMVSLIDGDGGVIEHGMAKGCGSEWIYDVCAMGSMAKERCREVVVSVRDGVGREVISRVNV